MGEAGCLGVRLDSTYKGPGLGRNPAQRRSRRPKGLELLEEGGGQIERRRDAGGLVKTWLLFQMPWKSHCDFEVEKCPTWALIPGARG